MDTQESRPSRLTAQRALEVYAGICAVLILIILYGSFERTDGGSIAGELYVRTGQTTSIGK